MDKINWFNHRISALFSPPKEQRTWFILEAISIFTSLFLGWYLGWNLFLAVWFAKCLFLAFRNRVSKIIIFYFALSIVPFGLIIFNIYCFITL